MVVARRRDDGVVGHVGVDERLEAVAEGVRAVLPHLALDLDRAELEDVWVLREPQGAVARQLGVPAQDLEDDRL